MNGSGRPRIDVALVHYPVVNRVGEIIGSAVTNLDLHDIARAGRTYGIHTYWVVTPYDDQLELADQIVRHWTEGHGAKVNPHRREALSLIRICRELAEAVAAISARWGRRPNIVATCARDGHATAEYAEVRARLAAGEPQLLLFGTAWGLAPEVLKMADVILPPLQGRDGFNHLSVRSAASIIMDRLLSRPVQ